MAINTKTNEHLLKLIADLKKKSYDEKVNTWSAVAEDLSSPTRKSRIVNLYKLSLYVNDNETALVPGKVLGSGEMTKKMTIGKRQFQIHVFRVKSHSTSLYLLLRSLGHKPSFPS